MSGLGVSLGTPWGGNVYFDTSALNRLYGDPDRNRVVSYLKRPESRIYLSAINIGELAMTPVADRRAGLLSLAAVLAEGILPMTLPGELLWRYLKAFRDGAKDVNTSMEGNDPFCRILSNPDGLTEEERREVCDWRKQEESTFRGVYNFGRSNLVPALDALSTADQAIVRRSAVGFMKYMRSQEALLEESFGGLLSDGGFVVYSGKAKVLFDYLEAWRLYWAVMGMVFYRRVLRRDKYGNRHNLEGADVAQVIYLLTCGTFVTEERKQRRLMQVAARLGSVPRQVMSYDEYRSRL